MARSRLGFYLPFSMAFIVCLLTPSAWARSSGVRLCTALRTLMVFSTASHPSACHNAR